MDVAAPRVLIAITTLLGSMPPEWHCCVDVGVATRSSCGVGGSDGVVGVWKGTTIAMPSSVKPSRCAAIHATICWGRELSAHWSSVDARRVYAQISPPPFIVAEPQWGQHGR